VVVTGKGGVGKTVLTAIIGVILAGEGRRVLLLESDPRENLHHLFSVPPSGGDVVEAGANLLLKNASPRAIIDQVVRDKLRVGAVSRRVLASPVYRHFVDGAPGLKEMMLLGHAMLVTEGEEDVKADAVVIDAPASGHGLSLLAAPLLVAEVIGTGPLGQMASRIARLIGDPARSAVVLASLAEEMPMQEALETITLLRERLGRPAELVVVNGLYPPLPQGRRPAGLPSEAAALWTQRRRTNERELERLAEAWKGPTARLPMVPIGFGPSLVARLAQVLREQLPMEAG
jgi:anion-transporting  ArsA/GET3 family ATPase